MFKCSRDLLLTDETDCESFLRLPHLDLPNMRQLECRAANNAPRFGESESGRCKSERGEGQIAVKFKDRRRSDGDPFTFLMGPPGAARHSFLSSSC